MSTRVKTQKHAEEVPVEVPSVEVPPVVSVEVPPVVSVEVPVVETETVRTRLERLLREFEDEKKEYTERILQLKSTIKMYDAEMKMRKEKKPKRVVDPNRPVSKNGIAKPQVISDDLSAFLSKYFKIPKGTLVSRTGALSKENGISKYITDKGLRKDGEIHPDNELVKLFGQPTELGKDGKTKVYNHKTIMKLIGKHFPTAATKKQ